MLKKKLEAKSDQPVKGLVYETDQGTVYTHTLTQTHADRDINKSNDTNTHSDTSTLSNT